MNDPRIGRSWHPATRDTSASLRIAMWSGPRNISTAMMRAWENRGDCAVSDEPLYAAYLAATGLDHPGRDEVIAAGETDPSRVIETLLGPVPDGKPIWYQKHMSHHLLPGMAHDWIPKLRNILLIRDPVEVVASYVKSRATVAPKDIGVLQQVELFDEISRVSGTPPPVIDAGDFLRAPEVHLRWLCEWLDVDFTDRMLAWPAGKRNSDGVWAKHWYAAVEASTGFEPWRNRDCRLSGDAAHVAAVCETGYRRLHACRLNLRD